MEVPFDGWFREDDALRMWIELPERLLLHFPLPAVVAGVVWLRPRDAGEDVEVLGKHDFKTGGHLRSTETIEAAVGPKDAPPLLRVLLHPFEVVLVLLEGGVPVNIFLLGCVIRRVGEN